MRDAAEGAGAIEAGGGSNNVILNQREGPIFGNQDKSSSPGDPPISNHLRRSDIDSGVARAKMTRSFKSDL